MKNGFFKIVGGFSLFAAGLALLVSLLIGIKSASDFSSSADEDIYHPRISLDDFYKNKDNGSDNAKTQKSERTEDKNIESEEDKKYFERLEPLLDSIIKSLNEFAEVTNQESVNPDGLQNYMIERSAMLEREGYLVLLEELDRAAKELNSKAKEVAKLKPGNEKYIHWANDFLPWFFDSYTSKYSKELERIENEKIEAGIQKASAVYTASIAAGAFMIFVFFTLIVLLVQIERNTRAQ